MLDKPLGFCEYMKERHAATQRRRAGAPPPWSDDPVIASRKLCSTFRDDDRVSVEGYNIITQYEKDPRALAIAFRWVNKPATLQVFADEGMHAGWPAETIEDILNLLDSPFGTAYKINPPGGLWNKAGVAKRIKQSWMTPTAYKTAREQTKALISLNNAPFVSYQIMQDLRWLRGPYTDEQQWALMGPGAGRGLLRLAGTYTAFGKWRDRQQDHSMRVKVDKDLAMPYEWRESLYEILTDAHATMRDPRVNMFEIEHNLCEWDKYMRVATGEAKGTSFKPKPTPAIRKEHYAGQG